MDFVRELLFFLMVWAAPPEQLVERHAFPGWRETVSERSERYREIAGDAAAVAYNLEEHPLFGGPSGRFKTAIALLAIAHHESGFAPDVDRGPSRGSFRHARTDAGGVCRAQSAQKASAELVAYMDRWLVRAQSAGAGR